MTRIFDDIPRTDARPAAHSEKTFAFLNRVAGPFWDRTRTTMEEWFMRLPEGTHADIRGRVRSGDNLQFVSAYWEMYVHESLAREGFSLAAHPELPETTKRPDFLASSEDVTFYVEATVVGDSATEAAADHRRNMVYDTLDRLDSPNFILWLEIESEGPSSPSVRALRADLERWLRTLDADELRALAEEQGFDALPTYEWEAEGWRISFRAWPKKPEARGTTGARPLGAFGPARAAFIDDVGAVRADLEEKAGRYGKPSKPFVIALAVESPFYKGEYAMAGALFGRAAVQFDPDTPDSRHIRHRDGLWRGPEGPRNTRVSAVVAARAVWPWSPTSHEPVTWHNPWSAIPLPDVLPWESTTVNLTDGLATRRAAARRAHEVLGLPDGWPGPEDPFPDDM
jgi:hypothetical protein